MNYVTVVIVLSVSVWYIYKKLVRKSQIPHGLKEIPIEKRPSIFQLWRTEVPISFLLKKLGEKHDSLFKVKFGMRDVVMLNNFKIVKKTLLEKGNNFSGRWNNSFILSCFYNSGILFKDGYVLSKHRSFVLKIFQEFGVGRSQSEEIVKSECTYLLEELKELEGKTLDFSDIIPIYSANIISKFIMNKRFSREEETIRRIQDLLFEFTRNKDLSIFVNIIFPPLDWMTNWISNCRFGICFCNLINNKTRWKKFDEIHMIIQKEIADHKSRLNLDSEEQDFIDKFLIEQHKMTEKQGTVETFTDWQLIGNVFELFVAGYETTSETLGWSMMFMSRYPDIQNKVYNEIVDTIGKERMPTMNDKKSLNYTQAVMDEIFRLSSVVPLAPFHRTLNDTSVDGYYIPQNTLLLPNLLACHTDPKVWERPLEFYPKHFLQEDENGDVIYTPREELIPFGIGERKCLGQSIGKMEFMIFYLSLIQKFEVDFAEEISNEQYEEALKGKEGIFRLSLIKTFTFKQRN